MTSNRRGSAASLTSTPSPAATHLRLRRPPSPPPPMRKLLKLDRSSVDRPTIFNGVPVLAQAATKQPQAANSRWAAGFRCRRVTVERPRPAPPHGERGDQGAGRHPPPRARCRVRIAQGGAASDAGQNPRVKIEQRRADPPPSSENTLAVERGDLGRFGDKSKNARCAVRVVPHMTQTT